ncbi:hypothetical protein BAE44_0012327, partial [Dichanthelium oligosanthes]
LRAHTLLLPVILCRGGCDGLPCPRTQEPALHPQALPQQEQEASPAAASAGRRGRAAAAAAAGLPRQRGGAGGPGRRLP